MLQEIYTQIDALRSPAYRKTQMNFFKTDPEEYAAHDHFLGVRVPQVRKLANNYKNSLSQADLKELLASKFHEHRMLALLTLVAQFQQSDIQKQKSIYNFYKKQFPSINNWDLVDLSCYKIVGEYLLALNDPSDLYKFAESKNMWIRRVGIVSTFAFIRKKKLKPTFDISTILLEDKEDLSHKATGWMLREAGKVDPEKLEKYLRNNIRQLPRVTLRYAIERFEKGKRKELLSL